MAAEPRLIRRPLVRVGDRLIVGADLEALRALVTRTGAS
jgi:arsenate reductase-like glutaredoxin family protein